jgi:alkylhydroperoxidase family enzyme
MGASLRREASREASGAMAATPSAAAAQARAFKKRKFAACTESGAPSRDAAARPAAQERYCDRTAKRHTQKRRKAIHYMISK